MIDNPIERLNVYSTPLADGGIHINLRAMVQDLVAALKMDGRNEADAMVMLHLVWEEVDVEVTVPHSAKN